MHFKSVLTHLKSKIFFCQPTMVAGIFSHLKLPKVTCLFWVRLWHVFVIILSTVSKSNRIFMFCLLHRLALFFSSISVWIALFYWFSQSDCFTQFITIIVPLHMLFAIMSGHIGCMALQMTLRELLPYFLSSCDWF